MDENWDDIADWYAAMVRDGSPIHEFARAVILSALPLDLTGMDVLDVGCGEGLITRAVAARGARAIGADPTSALIEYAREAERTHPVGATYRLDDGATLSTVKNAAMSWVTAGLSFNNIPDLDTAVASVGRVLQPGGRLVFTVPHPCFEAPHADAVSIEGSPRRLVGDYFAEGLWRATNPHSVRRAGNYHRTISTYVTALMKHGFKLEILAEPVPDDQVRDSNPHRGGLPPFLLIRAAAT